jgi:hypothetical protein
LTANFGPRSVRVVAERFPFIDPKEGNPGIIEGVQMEIAIAALVVAVLNLLWDVYVHYKRTSPPSAG